MSVCPSTRNLSPPSKSTTPPPPTPRPALCRTTAWTGCDWRGRASQCMQQPKAHNPARSLGRARLRNQRSPAAASAAIRNAFLPWGGAHKAGWGPFSPCKPPITHRHPTHAHVRKTCAGTYARTNHAVQAHTHGPLVIFCSCGKQGQEGGRQEACRQAGREQASGWMDSLSSTARDGITSSSQRRPSGALQEGRQPARPLPSSVLQRHTLPNA